VVVHPNHGIGSVGKTVELEVSGETHRFLVVDFRRTALTLRIPERTLEQSGLRSISSKETMRAALAILPAPRAMLPGHWSRWANIYVTKLNSGKPELLAEVLRDLSPIGGSWKARLYDEAQPTGRGARARRGGRARRSTAYDRNAASNGRAQADLGSALTTP
jgi:RNA polymerase-interacting CarD/CdnL/TRCF family regulator